MKSFFFLFSIIFIFNSSRIHALTNNQAPKDINVIVESVLKNHKVPALAGAIVTSDGLIAIGHSGFRSIEAKSQVDKTDKWLLNSCTKSITATMIACLVEEEKLSWNTRVKDLFGEEGIYPSLRDITLEELLSHQSGLQRDFHIGTNQEVRNSKLQINKLRGIFTQQLLSKKPEFKRGEFHYSNAGYVIAAHFAEKVTNKSWEYLVNKYVFRPLRMKRSGFSKPPHGRSSYPRNAVGHGDWDEMKHKPIFTDDNDPTYGPAGWVHSTIDDWAKFVQDNLNGLNAKETKILSPKMYQKIHTGTVVRSENDSYALGWVIGSSKNHWHNGCNNRWYTVMKLNPAKDVAFIAATNIGDDVGGEAAAWDLVNTLQGYNLIP